MILKWLEPTCFSEGELAEVVSPARLALPERPRVTDIKVQEYEDSTGDDALDVHVILDDATPEEDWEWASVRPIFDAISAALAGAGETRFPYITAGTAASWLLGGSIRRLTPH